MFTVFLHCFQKAGLLGPDREEQNQNTAAVTDLCAAPDGSLIAAIVQGQVSELDLIIIIIIIIFI